MNKISDLLFDLIIKKDYPYINDFFSQEDLDDYFGFKVPFDLKESDQRVLDNFVEKWVKYNNFSIIEDDIIDYDFSKQIVSKKVIYSLRDKYYCIIFEVLYDFEVKVIEGPYEVERTITIKPVVEYVRKY